jgi:predicted RNA binding protein YcfA (HicA-like mRNA interferase family)
VAKTFTGRALRALLKEKGCIETRQKGSHIRVECGGCVTTVADHSGETIPIGTLKKIERDLEPCLGKGWLKS